MHSVIRTAGILLGLCCVFSSFSVPVSVHADASADASSAMQTMGNARFLQADTDRNGMLSQEEFQATFTQIQPEAFARIDTNSDGSIDQEEWQNFLLGHQGMTQGGRESGAGNCPMIIQPPSSSRE